SYMREHFFGLRNELKDMVRRYTDAQLEQLDWGGHDLRKVYAAYKAAVSHQGQPTVILAKTVKGYGMGQIGQGQNTAHQQEELGAGGLEAFRERFDIPLPDNVLEDIEFYRPPEDSEEMQYLPQRQQALGG